MRITLLGTGTSQGVPVIACKCNVCLSKEKKDKRLRSSVLIEIDDTNIVIDSGPDFRYQMLRENVEKLDAILFTHEHKDHTAGLDDVRSYNYIQKKPMEVYAEQRVLNSLKQEFAYVFENNTYPGVPKVNLNEITTKLFSINNIPILPIRVVHHKLPVIAYRIKDFTYITDANFIDKTELEKIKGTKVLVINALRREKHISHFNLKEALEIIEKVKPEKAYLTHISHYLGLYKDVEKELPKNVLLAYDGLKINVN